MWNVKKYTAGRAGVINILDGLAKTGPEPAVTVYLPAGLPGTAALPYLEQAGIDADAAQQIAAAVADSPTGTVLFWGQSYKAAISPPFPLKEKFLTGGYDTSPVKSLLAKEYIIGIVLVRLGYYSVGICRGEELIEHKTGTGLVHGRQRQGGSSSNRYRRRREEQTFHFLERVAEHVADKLTPYVKTMDYLVFGGARTTIQEFRKHSRFITQFDDRLLPPLLSIHLPGYEELVKSSRQVWVSRVTEFSES